MTGNIYTVFAIVRNLNSDCKELPLDKFRLWKIREGWLSDFEKAKKLFGEGYVFYGDWVLEKNYPDIPPVYNNETRSKIFRDIEDILLLLRLFRSGDLILSHLRLRQPDGTFLRQFLPRVLADIYSANLFYFDANDCPQWDRFAEELATLKAWESSWFQIARRFFLYGGGKEFNVNHNEIDRIVDYITSLEATLVPERDFVGRHLRERAIRLIQGSETRREKIKRILRDFYDVRSTIVHGSILEEKQIKILQNKMQCFEVIIREILVAALHNLSYDDQQRQTSLCQFYEVPDTDRGKKVYEDFCAIQSDQEKRNLAFRISQRISKLSEPL